MKAFIKSKFGKVYSVLSFALVALLIGTTTSLAAADSETVSAVTQPFETVKDTAVAILATLGGIAILLFAGIYAWKYGKKVFQIIAK